MTTISDYLSQLGAHAKVAASQLVKLTTAQKNNALMLIANELNAHRATIKQENEKDLAQGKMNGLTAALLDRLALTDTRIDNMIKGLHQVASLPDPVGAIRDLKRVDSGLQIGKMRTPIGVIGMIYESRPNVTVDAAALCLKSGNAVILRGGSEAICSNRSVALCVQRGLLAAGLPEHCVQLVNITDRAAVDQLITMTQYVDVIIPRGGKSLVKKISDHAKVPVIKHLDGICHVYVDKDADLDKAYPIVLNAKCYRYGICGAMETLLVHRDVAAQFLPRISTAFLDKQVELRGCECAQQYLTNSKRATEDDWSTEYLAAILSIRVVDNIDQAIQHINYYGSHHTDSIVTEHCQAVTRFINEVDSSSVMHNVPTCFADGFEYGLGAEIGISTDKLHVRGPVGLEGLTTEKYVVFGDGQLRG